MKTKCQNKLIILKKIINNYNYKTQSYNKNIKKWNKTI